MPSELIRSLNRHASRRPHAIAVREVSEAGKLRDVTWRQLRQAALEAAWRLRVRPERGAVLVRSQNRVELLATMLGALWADVAVAPVSPALRESEVADLSRRLGITTFLGEAESPRVVPLPDLSTVETPPEPDWTGSGGSILLSSSGTTGLPKLVRRRAAALDAAGAGICEAMRVSERDVMLVAIPLYHSYGIDQALLAAMISGCRIELHSRFDPALVRTALAERGVTLMPAVPLMFDAISRIGGTRMAPALRSAVSAGSPLPRRVFDAFHAAYGVSIGQLYGATEFGSVSFNDPADTDLDPESAGRPFKGVQFRILDVDAPDLERPLPVGAEGQVAVSAPSMFSSYVDDARPATEQGFFMTGDLGRVDETGRLWLTGRLGLLVDVGGLKVNLLEVERVLARHPDVREVVALAVTYSDTAQRVKAIVIPEADRRPTAGAIREWARRHLAAYKVPRSFEIREDLPRSPTGKILRQELD